MDKTMLISPTHGDIYFDAVLQTEHRFEVSVTEHPIQSGSSVTDHAYVHPDSVTLEIGMSDVMAQDGEDSHSSNMFALLKEVMYSREPITLVTRFQTYEDMVITAMSVPDNYAVMNGMKANITLQHIVIVTAQTVDVRARIVSSKSGTSKPVATTDVDDPEDLGGDIWSWLYIGVEMLGDAFSGTNGDRLTPEPSPKTPPPSEIPDKVTKVGSNYLAPGLGEVWDGSKWIPLVV